MDAPKKQPLYFVKHSAKMDGGGQLHVPAALLPEEVSGFPPWRTSGGSHIRPRCCREQKNTWPFWGPARTLDKKKKNYMGSDKSLARPGRKQATATEDFDFHISYL